jgi:hypothetical protein
MHKDLLLKSLEENTPLHIELTNYFRRHPSQDESIVKILIYFAAHQSNNVCNALAQHLDQIFILLRKSDTEQYRKLVDELNAEHPFLDGSLLLYSLFERGLLSAIHQYIRLLPIFLDYQNLDGNTIFHQLSYACGNIYSYIYNNSMDDEIDNGGSAFTQMEHAKDILDYLTQEKMPLLLSKNKYAFNNKGESALFIFLMGYKNSLHLDFSADMSIPFLNNLLVIYPKKIIIDMYENFCVEPNNFTYQFLKNIVKDALLSKEITLKRLNFHKNNVNEVIFPKDLNIDKPIIFSFNRISCILSQISPNEDRLDLDDRDDAIEGFSKLIKNDTDENIALISNENQNNSSLNYYHYDKTRTHSFEENDHVSTLFSSPKNFFNKSIERHFTH